MKDHPIQASEKKNTFFREVEIEYLIHELKDPIAVIETGVRTLLEQREKYGALSQRQERTLMRSLRNVRKAREMLYGLLEIGRSEAGCFCCRSFYPSTSIVSVLMDILELMAPQIADQCLIFTNESEMTKHLTKFGIHLAISSNAQTVEMYQDETKFRQIVGNLLKNAFHYRKDRIDIRMYRENDVLVVEVSDDGPGIEPEYQDIVFKRYSKPRVSETHMERQGHGLGLSGSFIIAKYLGGSIQLISEKGKGATFKVSLPIRLPNEFHDCKLREEK